MMRVYFIHEKPMKKIRKMVFFSITCYYFAFIPLILCEQKPFISHISKEKIKEIGEEVEFNCTVQNTQDYPVLWIKFDKDRLDRAPLSSNTFMIVRDKRVSVKYDSVTSTYSLKIKNLQEADTGYYQCQILISISEKVSTDVELQIRRPAMISHNTTRFVNVIEGNQIELRCNADGFPVPRISWKRENDILLPSGGAIYRGNVLIIENAHRDDRGVYHCIAENGVGAEAKVNATVTIDFAPVITAIRPRVGQALGYDVGLECKVEAHPRPVISWFKNNFQLKREEPTTDIDEFVDTYLRYSVGTTDFGEYICRAENKYGFSETKIELFETTIPVCTTSCG